MADCSRTRSYVVVNTDGTFRRAIGTSATRSVADGEYEVDVPNSVALCEFNAASYLPAVADPIPALITLSRTGTHTVDIDVYNAAGKHMNGGFILGLDCSSTGEWGYISSDGWVDRGTGLGTSEPSHTDTGKYEISFDSNMNNCALIANVTYDSAQGPAFIYASIGGAMDSVYIDILDLNGRHVDRDFYLDAICQAPRA